MTNITSSQAGSAEAGRTYITKEDVAKLFGVTVRSIDEWMRKGILPYYKISHLVRFRVSDIEQALNAHCRRGAQTVA